VPLPAPKLLFGNGQHPADVLPGIQLLRCFFEHWVDSNMSAHRE